MGTIPEEGVLYDYNVRRDEFHIYILHQGQLWPLNAPVQSVGFDDTALAKALHTTTHSLGFVSGFRSLRTGDYVPKITRPEGQLIIPFSTLEYSESYELVMGTLGKDHAMAATGFLQTAALRGGSVPPPRAIYTKSNNNQRENERDTCNSSLPNAEEMLKGQLLEKISELQRQVLSLQIGHAEVGRKLEGALQNEASEHSITDFDQSVNGHPLPTSNNSLQHTIAPTVSPKSTTPPPATDPKSIPQLIPQTLPMPAVFQAAYPLPPSYHTAPATSPYNYPPAPSQYPPQSSYPPTYGAPPQPPAAGSAISPYQPRPSSPIDPASWTRRVQSIEGAPTYYAPQQYAHPTNYRDYMYHA